MINEKDKELILGLATKLVGYCPSQKSVHPMIIRNIERRMIDLKKSSLPDYLRLVEEKDEEFSHFLSLLTIHTTSWFRELPHFKKIEDFIRQRSDSKKK